MIEALARNRELSPIGICYEGDRFVVMIEALARNRELSPIGICYEGDRFVSVIEALARLYGNTCSSKPWFCADAISTRVSLAG